MGEGADSKTNKFAISPPPDVSGSFFVLFSRVKQHVPMYLRKAADSKQDIDKTPSSAIGNHLKSSRACLEKFSDDRFRIINRGRSEFHLSVLEALYISTRKPVLCTQKKFVYSLIFPFCKLLVSAS